MKPEILYDEPWEIYHGRRDEFLSSHRLGLFRRCPALYWAKVFGDISEQDSDALQVGRAAHCLVLEGRKVYEQRFTAGGPINERTGKPYGATSQAFGAWAAEVRGRGLEPISQDQADLASDLAVSVYDHEAARMILGDISQGHAELVIRADYAGIPCQIRIDKYQPRIGLIDFKTAADLDGFPRDARRWGYVHQVAFYRMVAAQAIEEVAYLPCYLIAVEKAPPFRVGVWSVLDADLARAAEENEAAIRKLIDCRASSYWPTGYEDIRVLTMEG